MRRKVHVSGLEDLFQEGVFFSLDLAQHLGGSLKIK